MFDQIGMFYVPVSNIPIEGNPCAFNVGGVTLTPVRRQISRCDANKNSIILIAPQLVGGTSFNLYKSNQGGIYGGGDARMRLKITNYVNGVPVRTVTSSAEYVSGTGSFAMVTSAIFNSLSSSNTYSYTQSSFHTLHTKVEIQGWHGWRQYFVGNGWRTSYTLETCNSSVSNVDGTPDFSVIAGNFINNVWPNHYSFNPRMSAAFNRLS